jgi:uncharacterized protein YaaQ
MNDLPAWNDESLAGSLFPNARPSKSQELYVALPFGGRSEANAVDTLRAKHDAATMRRHALREVGESEEERQARWRDARKKALDDIRHERKRGLPPRDDGGTVDAGQITFTINIDPAAVAAVRSAIDDFAATIRQTFTPALRDTAERFAALGFSAKDATTAIHQLQQVCLQPWARDDAPKRSMRQIVDDLSVLADGWAAPESRPPRRRKRSNGKPPQRHGQPSAERYLPGTRHSHKGGWR